MKATPDSPASVDSVMAKAMMLVGALDDSCEEATSLPFLEAVTALRAEVARLAAQAAPLAQQAREYPPLPKLPTMTVLSELQSGTQEMVRLDVAHEAMRAYVDADRAAAHVEPPSMPSSEWLAEAERIAGEFTVAVANGESAAAALAYSNLRAHLSRRVTADAPQLKHAGWFREMPSAMSHRVFEQVHHEPEQGDVELFERVIPADGEVRS